MGIDAQSFMDQASGEFCPECKGQGCESCDWQGLVWPEPLPYTEADRSYDLHAIERDYGRPG